MKQLLSTLIIAACLTTASYAFGVTTETTETKPLTAEVGSQKLVKGSEFTGIIKKLDDGTALYTKDEIYPLIGGNFETIVGKEVLIIGKVVKENDIEKLSVARVQFAKQ